jgi:hypothetical protein
MAAKIRCRAGAVTVTPTAAAVNRPAAARRARPAPSSARSTNAPKLSAIAAISGTASRLSTTRSISTASMTRTSSRASGLATRRATPQNASSSALPLTALIRRADQRLTSSSMKTT